MRPYARVVSLKKKAAHTRQVASLHQITIPYLQEMRNLSLGAWMEEILYFYFLTREHNFSLPILFPQRFESPWLCGSSNNLNRVDLSIVVNLWHEKKPDVTIQIKKEKQFTEAIKHYAGGRFQVISASYICFELSVLKNVRGNCFLQVRKLEELCQICWPRHNKDTGF